MVQIYRTDDRIIHEEEKISPGAWVNMVNPTVTEGEEIARELELGIGEVKLVIDLFQC